MSEQNLTASGILDGLVTKKQVAIELRKSERTIGRLIAQGLLPSKRIGNTTFIIVARANKALRGETPVKRGRPGRQRA